MKQTFYLLHGEDAVKEFAENGASGCKKLGYNVTSKIDCDLSQPMDIFIKKVFEALAGSLDSCLITEEDYKKLEN